MISHGFPHCSIDPQRDVIFLSGGLSGHRQSWMHIFSRFASNLGQKIHLVTSRDALGLEWIISTQDEFPKTICLHLVENGRSGIENEVIRIRSDFPNVLVSIGDAEEWIKISLSLRNNMRLLIMRPYLQSYSPRGILNYILKIFLTWGFSKFHKTRVALLAIPMHYPRILQSHWIDDVPSDYQLYFDRLQPIFEKLRIEIGLAENSKIILVPGFITKRKNPKLAVEAFEILRHRGCFSDCVLVFAGRIDRETISGLENKEESGVYVLDRYLTKEEYFGILKGAKLALLLYQNRASSGVTLDAIASSTPILLQGDGLWRNLLESYPKIVIRASKKSFLLANQIESILTGKLAINHTEHHHKARLNVVEFLLTPNLDL